MSTVVTQWCQVLMASIVGGLTGSQKKRPASGLYRRSKAPQERRSHCVRMAGRDRRMGSVGTYSSEDCLGTGQRAAGMIISAVARRCMLGCGLLLQYLPARAAMLMPAAVLVVGLSCSATRRALGPDRRGDDRRCGGRASDRRMMTCLVGSSGPSGTATRSGWRRLHCFQPTGGGRQNLGPGWVPPLEHQPRCREPCQRRRGRRGDLDQTADQMTAAIRSCGGGECEGAADERG